MIARRLGQNEREALTEIDTSASSPCLSFTFKYNTSQNEREALTEIDTMSLARTV
jgi:hypothetical protein